MSSYRAGATPRLRRVRSMLRLLGIAAVAALPACGGASSSTEATTAGAVTTSAAPQPSTTTADPSTPKPTATPVVPGNVVLTADQRTALCTDTDGQSGNSTLYLQPRAVALLVCDGSSSSRLLSVDLTTGMVRWEHALVGSDTSDDVVVPGTDHVVVVTSVSHPAEGLANAYVARTVTVLDAASGQEAWSGDLEAWVPKDARANGTRPEVKVWEGPGRDATRPQLVVLVDGWTAFEAATGSEIWHRDALVDDSGNQGSYVGAGIALTGGDNGTYEGFDAATGKAVWAKPFPDIARGANPVVVRDVAWLVGGDGVLAVDIRTGRLALNRKFPAEWDGRLVATPARILAFDGTALAMYSPQDIRTPLWSVPGENARPVLAATGLALVDAESGRLVLDGKDGTARTDVEALDGNDVRGDAVDGLVELSDGSVLAVGVPGE